MSEKFNGGEVWDDGMTEEEYEAAVMALDDGGPLIDVLAEELSKEKDDKLEAYLDEVSKKIADDYSKFMNELEGQ